MCEFMDCGMVRQKIFLKIGVLREQYPCGAPRGMRERDCVEGLLPHGGWIFA
jgi:hypothetical protein